MASNLDSKFVIRNINSKSDQYSSPCVTRLKKKIVEWIPIHYSGTIFIALDHNIRFKFEISWKSHVRKLMSILFNIVL